MQQIVSITTQGQITIPSFIRKQVGLDKYPKAAVSAQNNKIIIEPLPDILSLGGILAKKSIENKGIDKIIALENKTAKQAVANKYSSRCK